MNSDIAAPVPHRVSDTYDPKNMEAIVNELYRVINAMRTPGVVRASKLNVSRLPTASTGLRSGDIWANSNVLTVIP